MTDTVFQTKQSTAAALGLSEDQIGVHQIQLDQLLSEGILIDIDITGESMFSRQADWSDLGIQDGDARSGRMMRGQKYLISESRVKVLRSVTTRMRQALENFTVDVAGFRPWRYLNYKRYEGWVRAWNNLVADFMNAKDDILEHYDEDVDLLAEDFRKVAMESWRAIRAQGYQAVMIEGKPVYDSDVFCDYVIARAVAKMPSLEKIQNELTCNYRPHIIQGRDQIAAMNARAAEERAKSDAIYSQERAQAQLLSEQVYHEKKMHRIEEEERQARIDLMIHTEAEHIRQLSATEVSPIEQIFTDLRRQMGQIAIEMRDSIAKSGFIRGKTAEKAANLVEYFDAMKIQDDYKLREALLRLHAAIGPVGGRDKDTPERSVAEVNQALEEIAGMVQTAKADLLAAPSRFSLIE